MEGGREGGKERGVVVYLCPSQGQLCTLRLDVRPSLARRPFFLTLFLLLFLLFVLLLGAAAAAVAFPAFPFLTLTLKFLLCDRRPVK